MLSFVLEKTKTQLGRIKKQLTNKSYGEYLMFSNPKNHQLHYVGQVRNNKANGLGITIFDTGSRYEGYWSDILRQGEGAFYWSDDQYYKDLRNGIGAYVWHNIYYVRKYPDLKRFSRIPIYTDNPDNITGYVLKDEVYKEMAEDNHHKKLGDLKRKIFVVDRNVPVPDLFEKFVAQKEPMALVVDEYGSVSGLVSMEDVIETLLGLEIMDESDKDSNMQELARKNWETRAKRLGIIDENN